MEWLYALMTVAGLLLLVMWRQYCVMHSAMLKAAEYAGFTQNNFELFAQGKVPTPEQILFGIRQQPNRLGQQALHLAVSLRGLLPEEKIRSLEESKKLLEAFLKTHDSGSSSKKEYSKALTELMAVVKAAERYAILEECPPYLRERLSRWSREVLLWMRVVWMTLNHWKHRQESEASRE